MTTRKKKKTPRAVRVEVKSAAPVIVPVTVNRVTCDGTLPGGFRVTPVPVQPGERI